MNAALELIPDARRVQGLAKSGSNRRPRLRPLSKGEKSEAEKLRLTYRAILHDWLREAWGDKTAGAFMVLTDPTCDIQPLLAHRMLHAMLPTDRPTALDLPAIDGPRSYKKAIRLVGEAARVGRITTSEAQSWQRVLENEYTAWVRELSSRGLCEP